MKAVKDFWKDHTYFLALISLFVEIVHMPFGFSDVSLCSIMFVAKGKEAIKGGFSTRQKKIKMSFVLCNF